jgi:hypothetical protein
MKHSALFLAAALVATAGAANLSQAADLTTPVATQAAAMPADNLTQQAAIENEAEQAYQADANPLTIVKLASPYDQEDAFKGPGGYPLPGWDVFTIDAQAND